MNRRERRSLSKKFGSNNSFTKLYNQKQFEKIRQNNIDNKHREQEIKENHRILTNQKADQIANQKISSIATSLMIKEDLDYIDALEKAKEIYKKETAQA